MRRAILVASLVPLFASLSVHAQFQPPTKDELAMTADPKAHGAEAVYLSMEDITSQPGKTHIYHDRIKVLTEAGKEMATIRTGFDPGHEKIQVEGRTIHPDGTIIPLVDNPSDLVDFATKHYRENQLVFTLPSVEVSSILEYRITIHYDRGPYDPTWMIQQSVFVHQAHYAFTSFVYFSPTYSARIGTDAKVVFDKKDTYTLDMADIPPVPDEDWMPPLNTLKWRVSFFFTTFHTADGFWDAAGRSWMELIAKFTSTTGTLKTAANSMVLPGDTDYQKAQKIYAAVLKLENTDFTREKSKVERKKEKIKTIKNAQDVWRDQSGNADEITLLFVALCRAAGLSVAPMVVVDRSRTVFDLVDLSFEQFSDYIAIGKLDGKVYYLDPGAKECPFGMLDWRHTVTASLRPAEGGAATLGRTPGPAPKSSSVQRIASLNIDESGAVQGTVRVVLTGQDALRWRQLAILSDESEVKKLFNEWMIKNLPTGVQADFDHFIGLPDYDSSLIGVVKVSGSLGTVTGHRLFLPGLFFQAQAKHPFVTLDKRTAPIDVEYPKVEDDDVTYVLPAGYKVESSPADNNLQWPEHATLAIATKPDATSIQITRTLTCNYALLPATAYKDLHDFYLKLAQADQQPLVLSRASQPKTN